MLYFVVLALAVSEIVEIWHHSRLFAGLRAWLEVQYGPVPELLLCPFCFSVWVAGAVFLLSQAGDALYAAHAEPWGLLIQLGLQALALARAANLLNDVTHRWCRTPGSSSPSNQIKGFVHYERSGK